MRQDIAKVLLSRDQIAARVHALGAQLAGDLLDELRRGGARGNAGTLGGKTDGAGGSAGGGVVMLPILTGALVFTADLVRQMPVKLSLRVVAVSSYPGKSIQSKGAILASEIPTDLAGKHVVIIDDILDSGQTLGLVRELVERQGAASVRVCVLLRKPETVRRRAVTAEYVGFDIPDEFVVGYGLDFDGFYRNLPEIGVLRPEAARGGA